MITRRIQQGPARQRLAHHGKKVRGPCTSIPTFLHGIARVDDEVGLVRVDELGEGVGECDGGELVIGEDADARGVSYSLGSW